MKQSRVLSTHKPQKGMYHARTKNKTTLVTNAKLENTPSQTKPNLSD